MIMLQDIISTSFYVVIESVARLSGVRNPLKCGRKYETKPELNHHYNYRHRQKSSKATNDKCANCNKTFQRTKYLTHEGTC